MNKMAESGATASSVEMSALVNAVKAHEEEVKRLEAEGKQLQDAVTKLKASRTKNNKELEAFRAARKTDADSLYTNIDAILSAYDIMRVAYHGGDLTGGCVKI